jgi:hypothetical protein
MMTEHELVSTIVELAQLRKRAIYDDLGGEQKTLMGLVWALIGTRPQAIKLKNRQDLIDTLIGYGIPCKLNEDGIIQFDHDWPKQGSERDNPTCLNPPSNTAASYFPAPLPLPSSKPAKS